MNEIPLNSETCEQNLREGLALARKWKAFSRGSIALRDLGVNPWETPSYIMNFSPDSLSEANSILLVFDGGAISEDGSFVVKFPFVKDVLGNREFLDAFVKAKISSGTDEYILSLVSIVSIVSPTAIFQLCSEKHWKTDMFYVLFDKNKA